MLLKINTEFLYVWQVRLGVILSMSIQIILFFFGSRRKISEAVSLKILVWCAYVSADAVAIFSLSLLAQNRGESLKGEPLQNRQLHLLWVPFLILRLGGPDTITAFSLEDNKLWLRHLLSLVIQVGVALFAIIKSWSNHNPLTYLVIPICILGAVKYCERIWALKSATFKRIYDRFASKLDDDLEGTHSDKVSWYLSILAHYFADRTPSALYVGEDAENDFRSKTPREAFKLVETQIGLMYDVLYTKALSIYSWLGICLRCVYLVTTIAIMTIFVIMHKRNDAKWPYPLWDVLITYFVMIGAVILEIYGVILVVFSDWALIWLDRQQNENAHAKSLFQIIRTCSRALFGEKRWSRRMKQYNILRSLTLAPSGDRRRIHDVLPFSLLPWEDIDAFLGKDIDKTLEFDTFAGDDDDGVNEIRELSHAAILGRLKMFDKKLQDYLGNDDVMKVMMCFTEFLRSEVVGETTLKRDGIDVEFLPCSTEHAHTLFAWHIATTLCYYCDKEKGVLSGNNAVAVYGKEVCSKCNASRYVSDYLMYLARFHQKMLPPGNYKQLFEQLEPYLRYLKSRDYDFVRLLEHMRRHGELEPSDTEDAAVFRAFTDGVTLAVKLQDDVSDTGMRWETIAEYWGNMLLYTASFRRWEEHAQRLTGGGGEFITHVAFLLALASMFSQEGALLPLLFMM